MRSLFWLFVVAFNLVGAADLIIDYYNATQLGLPALAGELGSTYVIPIIYVPLLMITHVVAFYLLVRHQWTAHRVVPKADLAGGLGQQQQLAYHGTALQHFVRSRCLAKR
jgi:hypothetical protein